MSFYYQFFIKRSVSGATGLKPGDFSRCPSFTWALVTQSLFSQSEKTLFINIWHKNLPYESIYLIDFAL